MPFKEGRIIQTFILKGKKVVFRYPKRSDVDDFLRHINSLVEEKAFIIRQTKVTKNQEKKRLVKALEDMKKGYQIQICIEVDGKFAGSSEVIRRPEVGVNHTAKIAITLSKEFRGLGIGTKLLETMEGLARKKGIKVLELLCYEHNITALHVYEKAGFTEIGRVPMGLKHYGNHCSRIVMAKVLK